MDKRILILGGSGRMGQILARELSKDYLVTIADIRMPDTTTFDEDIQIVKADLENYNRIRDLIDDYNLVVGCLPADISYRIAFACADVGKHLVDLSYMPESPNSLDNIAKASKSTIIVDAGLAPGLTNLIAGRVWADEGYIHNGKLMVGGMAADKNAPYGYRLTWSPKDLLAEYTRPAHYINQGLILTMPALSGVEEIHIPGVGVLEAFLTDGLRSLLTMQDVDCLAEKTLRWPGHIKAAKELMEKGTFIEEMQENCSEGDDIVVFHCNLDDRKFTMIEHNKDGLTAMQRTTALTCATFTRLLSECGSLPYGVLTPEEIGRDVGLYNFMIETLKSDFGIEIIEEK